jgi:hypothetical protein
MEETTQPNQDFEKFIETCTEHELYFVIDEAGAFIWRMNHMLGHGQIPEQDVEGVSQDIIAINKMQGEAAQKTKRFGVNFELVDHKDPLSSRDVKIPCPEYWAWLKHWNEWKKNFTDESWDAFMAASKEKADLTEYLPKTRWHE